MSSPRKKGKRPKVLVGIALLGMLGVVNSAPATEEPVYKGPRGIAAAGPAQAQDKASGTEEIQKALDASLGADKPYDPTGKPDPFRSFIAEQEEYIEKRKRKPKTYLETLELSQMDLIVTILSDKGNWAMVRDNKGLGHVIRKGTSIGTNEGVVTEIKEGVVVIQERVRDVRGQEVVRDVQKKMPSAQ
jgi:type IV pilus assembly protein PilP